MKIAIFTDAYLPNINGVTFAVESFSQLLSKRHQIEIYAPAYCGKSQVERKNQVIIRRYRSVAIPTYKETHVAFPDVVKLVRSVEKFDPDVIHFHSPGTMGLLGILIAKARNIPLVGTYHTLLSETLEYASLSRILEKYFVAIDKATGGFGIDLKLLKTKKKKESKSETLSQKMVWNLVNKVYGYSDLVLCPSPAIKRELVIRHVKCRVEVLSNGMDLERFSAKKTYTNQYKVLHAGRLSFEKNIDVVIKAFHRVNGQFPQARLTIAGDGPARKDLEKLVGELKLTAKVKFLGMVPREKLADIYREHDIFITASDMETLGLVVLEAMASGLPVVGVNKYALPDLIKNGRNGYVVKVGDDKAMADSVIKILKNQRVVEKMGRESRRLSLEHDMTKSIAGLERFYKIVTLSKRKNWTASVREKISGLTNRWKISA